MVKCVLVATLTIWFVACIPAQGDVEARTEAVEKVKSFTDQELRQSLGKLLSGSRFRDDPLYEPCLNEVVRRGGKTWESYLNAKLKMLNGRGTKSSETVNNTTVGVSGNLELVTALRRVQKKRDPLVVVLDAKPKIEATPLSLPRLKCAVKNVDSEKAAVGFRDGGDGRSGRQARWRIVVRNSNGVELPEKSLSGLIISGGQYQEREIKFGETWETALDVRSFVRIDEPGTYSLEVLYHDTKCIADEADIDGLIVARSKPIVLVVRPLLINVSPQERKQIAQWIALLDGDKRLKIVAGTYGKWAHKFVPPTTPEGNILSAGVKAVPLLIEALADKSLSENKRAWLLALLFSATGENDPRHLFGAVGAYDYRETGWQLWGESSEGGQSGCLTMPSEGTSTGSTDRETQDRLIETWKDWLKTVEGKQGGSDARQAALVADAKDLKSTIVTPHLRQPIPKNTNVLWCGTFQLAWNELFELTGGPIVMQHAPDMVSILNERKTSKKDLDESCYVAIAGSGAAGTYDRIEAELRNKFKGQASPRMLKRLNSPAPDWVAYAYLFKQLPFQWTFTRFHGELKFLGTPVEAFGIEQLLDEEDTHKMASQVAVLDYASPTDFIIELRLREKDERLILAKVPPRDTLEATIAAVDNRILGKQPTKMEKMAALKIPVLDFDLMREYGELCGKTVHAKKETLGDAKILSAAQSIRFRLDETGAVLQSDAWMAGGMTINKDLIFDTPFLILLKRREAKAPYFALWVGNIELLLKAEKAARGPKIDK